jgi:hypothetical protein
MIASKIAGLRPTALPLPGEEGWGEGERNAISYFSDPQPTLHFINRHLSFVILK